MKSKYSLKDRQIKLGNYLQPKQEAIKRITGRLIYHEGSQFKSKIVMSKEIKDVIKELEDKNGDFQYDMDIPLTPDAKNEYIEALRKNIDSWPIFLWIEKIKVQ